jgi:hypothetical protein
MDSTPRELDTLVMTLRRLALSLSLAFSGAVLAQEAPTAAKARASFFAKNTDNRYSVTIDGKTCDTPCTVDLASGFKAVTATGSGDLTAGFNLPPGDWDVTLQHGSALRGVGLVLGIIGFTASSIITALELGGIVSVGLIFLIPPLALMVLGLIFFFAAPAPSAEVTARAARSGRDAPGHSAEVAASAPRHEDHGGATLLQF